MMMTTKSLMKKVSKAIGMKIKFHPVSDHAVILVQNMFLCIFFYCLIPSTLFPCLLMKREIVSIHVSITVRVFGRFHTHAHTCKCCIKNAECASSSFTSSKFLILFYSLFFYFLWEQSMIHVCCEKIKYWLNLILRSLPNNNLHTIAANLCASIVRS
jgi:hypothetical protein